MTPGRASGPRAAAPGSHGPTYDSRRARADRRTLIDSRVATVVIHAAGSSISSFLAGQAQQRLLGDVLGLRHAAEHPVGHAEPVPAKRLEIHVFHVCHTHLTRHGARL